MKKIIVIVLLICLVTTYAYAKEYVIRFEAGKRIVTIPCESEQDKRNKLEQANEWAKGNPTRTVKVADDNRNYIKLVGDTIVPLTEEEIDALQPLKEKTEKERFLELLKDNDIKKALKKAVQ